MNKKLPVYWTFAWRRVVFAITLAIISFIPLAVRAGIFTGPGLWTDETKWGGSGVPTFTSSGDWGITGYCGATNATLYGGAYMHIGRTKAGYADIENCIVSCKTFRVAHWASGVYRQKRGSFYAQGAAVGSATAYGEAGLYFEDTDVVLAGNFNVGNAVGKTGGDASAAAFHIKGGTFKQTSGTRTVGNGARAVFEGLGSASLGAFGVSYGTLAVVDSPGTVSTSERNVGTVSDKTGIFAVTNSTVSHKKAYFGTAARALGVLDIADGAVFTQNNQLYLGSGNTGTGIVHVANATWQHSAGGTGTEGPNLGSGANSYGEFHITGADSSMSDISVWKIGVGSNSTGRVVFDGVDWAKMKKSNFWCAMAIDATAYIDYRNIEATNAFTLWQGYGTYAGSKAVNTFDNCHYANTASSYFGSATKGCVVVCNGSTFDISRSGDVWMPNTSGADVSFFVTNSPGFYINAGTFKHEKTDAKLHFTFHDSVAGICTNSTFRMAENCTGNDVDGLGAKASITVSGNTELTVGTIMCFAAGESTFNLLGGTFTLGSMSGGSPTFNFNGGTLQSKSAQASWFPAASANYVCDGGAVFDARHDVTIPGVLRHGGTAAKDGGVTKKGAGTLTLSSTTAHEFTGDVVVEEGTLVATALSNWTLAAGQKIGGAGTLKVGSGFTAGGVRFDAAWEGGLTVDGDVAFAPGSTLDVTGIDKDTEGSRFTILTADSLSGAENISATGAPGKWKLRASATSLSIAKDTGFILIIR